MATGAARYDLDRFGAGAFRATPRQDDVMIVAHGDAGLIDGQPYWKCGSYAQMPEPKFVISMGWLCDLRWAILGPRLSRAKGRR